ncbi:MAG TPA: TerB family tellurite resistance protein [Streptosporangiaceae bacterium]|nr:TerB family tellurite resistance protein [Streptosporangiaceae bacterium]
MRVRLSSRVYYRTIASGVFHCERCGGDRLYRHRTGRRWAKVLCLPVVPLESTGEHLRCTICRTCYRVELLAVPTIEQMRAALRNAATATALAMLWAGGSASQAARRRAVELIVGSGSPAYGEPDLLTALGRTESECTDSDSDDCGPQNAGTAAAAGPEAPVSCRPVPEQIPGLRSAVQTLAIQLEAHAREWFLAKVVQVGLADGSLSAAERDVIGIVARYLGLSQARAEDVIQLAEEAAQAG